MASGNVWKLTHEKSSPPPYSLSLYEYGTMAWNHTLCAPHYGKSIFPPMSEGAEALKLDIDLWVAEIFHCGTS